MQPKGVATDAQGNVYISNSLCGLVEKLASDGTVTVVAGHVDPNDNYSAGITDGMSATQAFLNQPAGLTYDDATATLYIADQFSNRVLKVVSGKISVAVGNGNAGFSGDGGLAVAAQLNSPRDIAFAGGVLYVADSGNCRVRAVSSSGIISTLIGTGSCSDSGDGGLPGSAGLGGVSGLALDASGSLFIASGISGTIRELDSKGSVSTVASLPGGLGGIAFSPNGDLLASAAGTSQEIFKITGLAPPVIVPDEYVALGDSFSSGEGAPLPSGYLAGTNTSTNACHRSGAAYPFIDYALPKMPTVFGFHACSGALIQDFFSPFAVNHTEAPKNVEEPAQLSWLSQKTKVITLTIGGNNLGFADILDYCAKRGLFQQSCEKHSATLVASAFANIKIGTGRDTDNLPDLYATIKAKAPQARIYVLGYPRFFPQKGIGICSTGIPGRFFLPSDAKWINSEIAQLDEFIDASATKAGFIYVDTYDALNQHELCSSKPWINTAKLPKQESFHPNAQGQAAMAATLARKF